MPITVSECEKILGIFVNNDLSFKTHIFALVKKARQICNILLTTFNGVYSIILISLYKIYIRPMMLLYADELTLYRVVNNVYDAALLQ